MRATSAEDRSTEQMTFARTLVASHAKAGNIRQLTSTYPFFLWCTAMRPRSKHRLHESLIRRGKSGGLRARSKHCLLEVVLKQTTVNGKLRRPFLRFYSKGGVEMWRVGPE